MLREKLLQLKTYQLFTSSETDIKKLIINMVKQSPSPFKSLEGIYLWEIDRRLRKFAKKELNEEFKGKKIVVPLPVKKTNNLISIDQKEILEQTIAELDGLQLIRLKLFKPCKPVYMEKRMFNEVSRWIEIHIPA